MATSTIADLERLLAVYEDAQRKSEFAESIRCTATAIAGDRYKITFSEASAEGDK